MEPCVFCDFVNNGWGSVIFENGQCVCIECADEVLPGSCIIIPRAHRETVFDLTADEWRATQDLLDKAKRYIGKKYRPDGYNVGWNVGETGGQEVFHAHMHVIPRHSDEPLAGKGIRYWIKQKSNTRPRE